MQKKKYQKILQSCQNCFKTTSDLTECSYLSNNFCPWQTNYMQHSPREANSSSASQKKVSHILWKPEVHSCIQWTLPSVPILSQINPAHSPYPTYFLEAHFNIILSSMLRTSKWPLSLRFPHQNPICTSPLPPYVSHALPTSFLLT